MKYEEFVIKFNKQVFSLAYNKQLILAVEVCKKLYLDYVAFAQKYEWGNPDILLDAIQIAEQSKTQPADKTFIEQILKKVDEVIPDMDDFGGDILGSYALNAGVAVCETLSFLIDRNPKHIYHIGTCLTDTVDFKLQENKDLAEEQIDKNPLMIETRNFLTEQSR